MVMLSRGFSGKTILSTFFPNKDKSQNYKNDIRGHSITTETKRGRWVVNQMSMFVHMGLVGSQ